MQKLHLGPSVPTIDPEGLALLPFEELRPAARDGHGHALLEPWMMIDCPWRDDSAPRLKVPEIKPAEKLGPEWPQEGARSIVPILAYNAYVEAGQPVPYEGLKVAVGFFEFVFNAGAWAVVRKLPPDHYSRGIEAVEGCAWP